MKMQFIFYFFLCTLFSENISCQILISENTCSSNKDDLTSSCLYLKKINKTDTIYIDTINTILFGNDYSYLIYEDYFILNTPNTLIKSFQYTCDELVRFIICRVTLEGLIEERIFVVKFPYDKCNLYKTTLINKSIIIEYLPKNVKKVIPFSFESLSKIKEIALDLENN